MKKPELLGEFVAHILSENNVDPAIVADVQQFVTEIVPLLVAKIG